MGGKVIRGGERVFAFANAANRDPEAFENADAFDLGRPLSPHLTFGHGIHFCLGAPLARLEARIAAQRASQRFPEIALLDGEPAWQDSLILRGVKALPVRLG
jgi:cytochrome P450